MKTPTALKNMSAKTQKRILWAIAAVLVMAMIFAFSSQASFASEEASDALAELMNMEQKDLQTRVSNQSIFFGLTLRKLAHIFLFAALGFCVYQALADVKRRLVIAVGAGYLYGVLDEIHQSLAGRYGRWQDTLIDLVGVALGLAAALLLPKLNILCKKWFYEDWDTKHPVAKKRLEWCLDALSLAAVIQYVGYRFLQATMFEFIYSELYKTLTFLSLLVFGGVRFVYLFARKLWADADEKAQIRRFLKFVGVCVLAVPFFIVAYLHDYKFLIFIPICWMCLYDLQAELVFRWYVRVVGVLLAATVLCCLAGAIQNINSIYGGDFKQAYGIINGTDFAAYFLFLLLFAWCGWKGEDIRAAAAMVIAPALTGAYLFHLNGSRTTLICCLLISIAGICDLLSRKARGQSKGIVKLSRAMDALKVAVYPVSFLSIALVSYLYGQGVPWVLKLDSNFLSGRIGPMWKTYEEHGIRLFGSMFTMHGNGGSVLRSGQVYDFLDSGYAYMLLRFGAVVTAIISALWIWMIVRAIRNGKRQIAWSMAIISVYALSECQIVNVNYNVMLLAPFCALMSPREREREEQALPSGRMRGAAGVQWFACAAAAVLVGIGLLALPKALSWLRTLFYLNQWNVGQQTFKALVLCVAVILLVYAIWRLITLYWYRRRTGMLAILAAVVVALGAVAFSVNRTIDRGLQTHEMELDAELDTVRMLIASAEQPVYAMEKTELYQRGVGGISERIMTGEDMCLFQNGTILTDKSREMIWMTNYGGQYLQFSDSSGMYSFDPAVIETMTMAGYEWTTYYNSERTCNLDDLAQLNHLKQNEDGSLVLEDPEHSLSENRFMDQKKTDYEVRFALSLDGNDQVDADDEICTLYVMGYAGEEILLEQVVHRSDFDENGRYVTTIPYFCPFVPRMEYRVIAAEGVTLYVDEIAWRRVA